MTKNCEISASSWFYYKRDEECPPRLAKTRSRRTETARSPTHLRQHTMCGHECDKMDMTDIKD